MNAAGGSPDQVNGFRRQLGVAGASLVVGALLVLVGGSTLLPYLGAYLMGTVAVAVVVVAYRIDRALPVVVLVGALFLAGDAAIRHDTDDPYFRRHDGGVVATEAAARMVTDGINPYAADFTPALTPHHHTLDAIDNPVTNPLVEHYPYLPASFLAHVPLVALSDATGGWYDVRFLYVLAAAAAIYLVAGGSPERSRRAAAVWALVGSAVAPVFLSWGTNDTAAASLVLIGVMLAQKRPVASGIILAVAVSLKVLLIMAFVPLLTMVWARDRSRLAPLLLATALTGAATSLPFFVASPRAFVDDAIGFNLGLTERVFPVSGYGLGKHFSDIVQGPVLFGLSAVLVLAASAAAVWWVRRCPHPEVALFAAGVIVFAGLIPARTFQQTYAPLMVILWAPVWRLPAREIWPFGQRHPSTQPLPAPSTT